MFGKHLFRPFKPSAKIYLKVTNWYEFPKGIQTFPAGDAKNLSLSASSTSDAYFANASKALWKYITQKSSSGYCVTT